MKNKQVYIWLAGIALISIIAFVFVYPRASSAPTTVSEETQQAGTVSLTVQGLYSGREVTITENETVLQVLQALNAQDVQLQLATKVYSGMGTLVTGMGKHVNGTDNNYWQYKVNGVAPQIGADAYKLKKGDAVEWFFGASQE